MAIREVVGAFAKPLAFACGAGLLIAGCTPEIASDIYVSDLLAVLDGGEAEIPAIVSVEIPSAKECDKYGGQILELITNYVAEAKLIGCRSAARGIQSLADVSLSIPILNEKQTPKDRLAAVLVRRISDDGKFRVVFQLGEISQRLVADAKRANPMFSKPDLIKLTFDVQNDTRDSWVLETSGVFVDGDPVQMVTKVPLERRKPVRLILSDVGQAVAARRLRAYVFDASPG